MDKVGVNNPILGNRKNRAKFIKKELIALKKGFFWTKTKAPDTTRIEGLDLCRVYTKRERVNPHV